MANRILFHPTIKASERKNFTLMEESSSSSSPPLEPPLSVAEQLKIPTLASLREPELRKAMLQIQNDLTLSPKEKAQRMQVNNSFCNQMNKSVML